MPAIRFHLSMFICTTLVTFHSSIHRPIHNRVHSYINTYTKSEPCNTRIYIHCLVKTTPFQEASSWYLPKGKKELLPYYSRCLWESQYQQEWWLNQHPGSIPPINLLKLIQPSEQISTLIINTYHDQYATLSWHHSHQTNSPFFLTTSNTK